jgi:hypothetical protein
LLCFLLDSHAHPSFSLLLLLFFVFPSAMSDEEMEMDPNGEYDPQPADPGCVVLYKEDDPAALLEKMQAENAASLAKDVANAAPLAIASSPAAAASSKKKKKKKPGKAKGVPIDLCSSTAGEDIEQGAAPGAGGRGTKRPLDEIVRVNIMTPAQITKKKEKAAAKKAAYARPPPPDSAAASSVPVPAPRPKEKPREMSIEFEEAKELNNWTYVRTEEMESYRALVNSNDWMPLGPLVDPLLIQQSQTLRDASRLRGPKVESIDIPPESGDPRPQENNYMQVDTRFIVRSLDGLRSFHGFGIAWCEFQDAPDVFVIMRQRPAPKKTDEDPSSQPAAAAAAAAGDAAAPEEDEAGGRRSKRARGSAKGKGKTKVVQQAAAAADASVSRFPPVSTLAAYAPPAPGGARCALSVSILTRFALYLFFFCVAAPCGFGTERQGALHEQGRRVETSADVRGNRCRPDAC